jgi:hypothetical protein
MAISNWENLTPSEQISNWETFESKYQSIFDFKIYHKDNNGWETRLAKKRSSFFSKLPSIKDGMIQLFDNAQEIVKKREELFKAYFPDLKEDIPVYILPSLFSFNGKVAEIPGTTNYGLFIGVDYITYRKDNLNVLFSHEFFHVYHISKRDPNSNDKTMASPLWKEGFATYVSGLLNPDQADDVLLMDKDLANKCQDPHYVSELAKLYLPLLKTDGKTTNVDWFNMSSKEEIKRRGYCLGLKVIREIVKNKNNTILDMTTWDEDHFSNEITKVLEKLSTEEI